MRRAIILRHRRNKGLCDSCGMDPHEGKCTEDFTATDMRNLPKPVKDVDLKKKKDTVISYRRKKGLCEGCGMDPHTQPCHESYDKADNRSEEDKEKRPAIVITPKKTGPSILEQIEEKKAIELVLKPKKKVKLHRDFIILNLFKSTEDDIIEFSCISQLGRRFQDHILCVIGRIDKHFPYSDVMKIRKIPNVTEIKPCDEQTIVDHIGSCKKLFTFPAKLYIPVCIKYDIPYYEFPVGKNATNFHPDAAYRL